VPYWGKLLLLILSLVIHSFFAVPMMMSGAPIAADWYSLVQPAWLSDPLADSRLGGSIAWGFGEVPTLVVLIALCVQWARSDAREAKRYDRKADRDGGADLAAYNVRLAAMNTRAEADRDAGR
jgi:putative copper resistance protein D